MTLSSRVNPLDPAVEMVGDWNGNEGALRLSGDKPTIKFAGGAAAGGARWALHLGSRGPGNLEFLRETGPGAFDHVFTLSPTNRVGIGTSSPSATLEVAGDMKVTGGLTVNKIEFKTVVEQLNILRGDISHLSDNVSHLSTGPLTQQINSLQQQVSSLQAQVSSLQAKEASDVAGIANSLITLAARVTALGG